MEVRPCGHLFLWKISYESAACRFNQVLLWFGLMLASGCIGSGVAWVGLPLRAVSTLSINGLWRPGRCLKTVCDWLLPMLDLESCGGGRSVN